MKLARGDGVALTEALVQCDSRNPSLVPGAPGEREVAVMLAEVLRGWGIDAELSEVAEGRPNVIARIRGTGGGRSLMFNGHIDTVDTAGMTHAPFDSRVQSGRIYGRGSSDMKGGVAAMCAAAARLKGRLKGDLIIAAVADEEWESLGTRALVKTVRADAAIVTEPTRLRINPSHKGFIWMEVEAGGRAAHGSKWEIGVDAIRGAALVLAELDRLDREELPRRLHPLLGRASLHASVIEGGVGLSTYPERCIVKAERRTLPGEEHEDVVREFERACDAVRSVRPEFQLSARCLFSQPPSDVAADAPIAQALTAVLAQSGLSTAPEGMSAWTDAALLNDAGIPAICFGPGDMSLAHAAEEYIEVGEIEQATELLVALAQSWCS